MKKAPYRIDFELVILCDDHEDKRREIVRAVMAQLRKLPEVVDVEPGTMWPVKVREQVVGAEVV